MTNSNSDYKTYFAQLGKLLEEYLVKKAPALPKGLKEFLVQWGPWIDLVLTIMMLPAILAILGIGTLFMPFSFLGGITIGFNYIFGLIFTIVTIILNVAALPGLFNRKIGGWNLLYYSALIGVVHNIVVFNLGALIIGSLLTLYVLYQIKEYYK